MAYWITQASTSDKQVPPAAGRFGRDCRARGDARLWVDAQPQTQRGASLPVRVDRGAVGRDVER